MPDPDLMARAQTLTIPEMLQKALHAALMAEKRAEEFDQDEAKFDTSSSCRNWAEVASAWALAIDAASLAPEMTVDAPKEPSVPDEERLNLV